MNLENNNWIKKAYSELETEQAYSDIRDYYQRNKPYFDAKEKEADDLDELNRFLRSA